MGPLDALWHVLNLLAPAWGVALIATVLVKLVWYRGLRTVAFRDLFLWSTVAGVGVVLGGLVVWGHDGRMFTYLALVLAVAAALWWKGLRHLD